MENFIIDDFGFISAHVEDLESLSLQIVNTIRDECPSFIQFQAQVRSAKFKLEETGSNNLVYNHTEHPLSILNKYTYSLERACWDILYSISRLNMLAQYVELPGGQNTLISHYISYYFFDCISRGKAVVDILGLMINHLFALGVNKERCGLDRGAIAASLANNYSDSKEHKCIVDLCRKLEEYRNSWIRDFYELRNTVIHRYEFGTLAIVTICVDDKGLPERKHPFEVIFHETAESINYIRSIAPVSVIADYSVDPVLFYSGLWKKLALLIECVCDGCYPYIGAFAASSMADFTNLTKAS
jgi:hypothetical protein